MVKPSGLTINITYFRLALSPIISLRLLCLSSISFPFRMVSEHGSVHIEGHEEEAQPREAIQPNLMRNDSLISPPISALTFSILFMILLGTLTSIKLHGEKIKHPLSLNPNWIKDKWKQREKQKFEEVKAHFIKFLLHIYSDYM